MIDYPYQKLLMASQKEDSLLSSFNGKLNVDHYLNDNELFFL